MRTRLSAARAQRRRSSSHEERRRRRLHRVEPAHRGGQPLDRGRHARQVGGEAVTLQQPLDNRRMFVHGDAIPGAQLADEGAVDVGGRLVLPLEVHRQRLRIGVELQLLFRRGRPRLAGGQAAALVGELRHRELVIRIRDLQLMPQRVEPVHLAARDHPAVEAVANGRLVQVQHLPPGVVLRLGSDRVDQKRLAQVSRRGHVGPLPVRDQPAGQRLFGERRLPAAEAAHQEDGGRRDDHQLKDVRQPGHQPQRRRAGERIERDERRQRPRA